MYTLKAVGADPEFFLQNKNGKPVPAIGLIGGTKDAPKFINDDGFSAVQEDNVMVEYNIKPAQTCNDFVQNHVIVQAYLDKMIRERNLVPLIKPSATFFIDELNHPQAQQIGCSSDYNAWTGKPNSTLEARTLGLVRVAGGHIHVSYEFDGKSPSKRDQIEVVRMLDLALGIPSLVLDGDTVRRKYYGKAGAFRPKEYGIEYRTLSNSWIENLEHIKWVFNQVVWAFLKLKGKTSDVIIDDNSVIHRTINCSDKVSALHLIKKYSIPMPVGFPKGVV